MDGFNGEREVELGFVRERNIHLHTSYPYTPYLPPAHFTHPLLEEKPYTYVLVDFAQEVTSGCEKSFSDVRYSAKCGHLNVTLGIGYLKTYEILCQKKNISLSTLVKYKYWWLEKPVQKAPACPHEMAGRCIKLTNEQQTTVGD